MTDIKFWQEALDLTDWEIDTKSIEREQVSFDEDVPEEDKYFIGIVINRPEFKATIIHDRVLMEVDIIHELLHIKYPDWSEKGINMLTTKLLGG